MVDPCTVDPCTVDPCTGTVDPSIVDRRMVHPFILDPPMAITVHVGTMDMDGAAIGRMRTSKVTTNNERPVSCQTKSPPAGRRD
jgi:hypothetical protein